MTRRLAFGLFFVLLLALPAGADILHLKNGNQLEGKIVSETPTAVKIRTVGGVVEISRSDIASIERKKTPREIYEERLAALPKNDAEACYQLALFCKENRLHREEKQLYRAALAIDDQHPGANRAVGNVQLDGTWMTPEEAEKKKGEADAAAMRAKGLVLYKGSWVTPEEKENLEKGLVKHGGKWMTPDEAKEADGFVKVGGRWVKKEDAEREKLKDLYGGWMGIDVNVVFTPHFAAIGPYTEAELQTILTGAEKAYAEFAKIFGLRDGEDLFGGSEVDRDRSRLHIVYAKRAFEYMKFLDGMKARYPEDIPDERLALMKSQKGFYFVYPSCYIVGYQMPNPFEQVCASVVHKTSHVMLMRWHYASGFFPWWLIEGLGTYQEIQVTGRCDTYCITEGGYAAGEDPAKQKWAGESSWRQVVKAQVVGQADRSLIQLSRAGLNDLTFRDLAKCWSLCEWLTSTHPKEFVALVENLKAQMKFADAVQRAFKMPPEKLDKDWHDYVLSNY